MMPATGGNDHHETTESPRDSGDESEDEREILEESPCGRWQKRRVKVTQRDVPGIDVAYLAMDMEEGREVVWNEVQFSARRDYKDQEAKIQIVFDNLIQLEHPNIVKFYKYWTDTKSDRDKPRVIFITEYMSSGSLKQFLKRIKKDKRNMQEKSWRRWCTQILSALSYLHSCDPPIIHGNLTTDTVFIQHNGLIKIGSVAPDAINNHVKTYTEEQKNMHYIAPEYGSEGKVTVAADVYAFGICALEMAVLEIQGNGDSRHISRQAIRNAVDQVDDKSQKDFLRKSLNDVEMRPTARDLLLHQVLFEVHSLKLLAADSFVRHESFLQEHLADKELREVKKDDIIATLPAKGAKDEVQWRVSQVPALELEKFLEEVRSGIHPLTAYAMKRAYPAKIRPQSPETQESVKSATPEPIDMESRKITMMQCDVRQAKEGEESANLHLELLLRLDDSMNRQLSCELTAEESPRLLADELVTYGFISDADKDKVAGLIEEKVQNLTSHVQGVVAVAT